MNQVICPNCGRLNRSEAKFCAHCRAPMPSETTPQGASPSPNILSPVGASLTFMIHSRRRWLWVGIGGVILLLLVTVIVIPLWPGNEKATAIVTTLPTAIAIATESEATDISPTELPAPTEIVTISDPIPTSEGVTEIVNTPLPEPELIDNLLINGRFDQNWDIGWQRTIGANANGLQRTEVIDMEAGSTGKGLHLEHSGSDSLQLEQTVVVDPANVYLNAEVNLSGSINDATNAEGIGALMLVYRDIDQHPLGYSIWVNGGQRSSQLFGVAPLPPIGNNVSWRWLGEGWQKIDMDIRQEIFNSLPTINPDTVNNITIMLLTTGNENCLPEDCQVDIKVVDLVLSSQPGNVTQP